MKFKILIWEVHVAIVSDCEELNEKKFEKMEKERPDEMEVAT